MTILEKAIEVYGADLQKQVAIEKMAELTKEICKDFRGKKTRIILSKKLQILKLC